MTLFCCTYAGSYEEIGSGARHGAIKQAREYQLQRGAARRDGSWLVLAIRLIYVFKCHFQRSSG